jgi:hypothetical protein
MLTNEELQKIIKQFDGYSGDTDPHSGHVDPCVGFSK